MGTLGDLEGPCVFFVRELSKAQSRQPSRPGLGRAVSIEHDLIWVAADRWAEHGMLTEG
jgi:hypothetical protein